jgi:hypothetical protein
MSIYRKAGYRLAVLSVLVFGVISLTSTRASATSSCQLDCFHQEQACLAICTANPGQLGCREECTAAYSDCLSGC